MNEEYANISGSQKDKLKILSNNSSSLALKKKTARSNSTENTNDISMEQNLNTINLRNGRKKERTRLGDKKHSHMYIEKNLSYSPSMIGEITKNSQTPSLLIRNNLRNIDKVSPYQYNKSRNLYPNKYTVLNSNHSASNRVSENDYLDYSPYNKYIIK